MKLTKQEMENYRKYTKMRGSNLKTCKLDALNVHLNGEYAHELKKFEIFWKLRKQGFRVITEAWDKEGLRREIVDITNGEIYEIESSKTKRGQRHPKNINVIYYD